MRLLAALTLLAACATAPATATDSATATATATDPATVWPFRAWDHAEAVRFNDLPAGPGHALFAYDAAHGWSPDVVERKPLHGEQADRAVALVRETRGGVDVSSCAFPRHAIVLYQGATPIASVNVCFECGDILVWPEQEATDEKNAEAKLAAHDRVFPRWQALFRDELGWSITRPTAGTAPDAPPAR